jgi:replicative DNA helicase
MSIDVPGTLLCSILQDPEHGIEVWPKLKIAFFSSSYATIYNAINKFYQSYHRLPCFTELKTLIRDPLLLHTIAALELLEIEQEFDLQFLLDSLINEYTQNEAITKLETFADKLTSLDSEEVKEELANIVLHLEEKTFLSEEIVTMDNLLLFDEVELRSKVPVGISNYFDSVTGGLIPSELVYFGGERGSGKSVLMTNISVRQYEQENVSVFFTIEMRAREIFTRHLSCLAEVNHSRIRKGTLDYEELVKVARVRANMFTDADDCYEDFLKRKDYTRFEKNLINNKRLKEDNQIIIVDNSKLSIADIDLTIQKYKGRFGDKFKVAIIDYLNRIDMKDPYRWENQIYLSNALKDLARKHEIVIVSPYQIDKSGEARFAKGVLDSPDISLIMKANDDTIDFTSTKTRNLPKMTFSSAIDWETLRIDPADISAKDLNHKEEESDVDADLPF